MLGRDGGGISRDCVVEDFRCLGNDDDDHHSRNFKRKIDVGRIRVRDEPRIGRSFSGMNVKGDRTGDALPGTFFGREGGVYVSPIFGKNTMLSCGPNLCIRRPMILNNGL